MCLLPLTIFHNGGINDSHLFHKREPFTYGTPRSANLLHQSFAIRKKVLKTSPQRAEIAPNNTRLFHDIKKKNIRESNFLFWHCQLQTLNDRVLASKQQVNIYLLGHVSVHTSLLYMSGGLN